MSAFSISTQFRYLDSKISDVVNRSPVNKWHAFDPKKIFHYFQKHSDSIHQNIRIKNKVVVYLSSVQLLKCVNQQKIQASFTKTLKKTHLGIEVLDASRKNENLYCLRQMLILSPALRRLSHSQFPQINFNILFYYHCAKGNINFLKERLKNGQPLYEHAKISPLHIACEARKLKVVKLLLQDGRFSVLKRDVYQAQPLHLASQMGYKEIVKFLLSSNAIDIEALDSSGSTPLLLACYYGHLETAQLLIKKGASLKARNKLDLCCMHFAAMSGNQALISFLARQDPSQINSRDVDGNTPLHFACLSNEQVTQKLLTLGAKPALKDNEGRTALHYSCMTSKTITLSILATLPNIDEADVKGMTPLHLAAQKGQLAICQLLVEKKANILAKDNDGCIALHLSRVAGHREVVKYFFQHFFSLMGYFQTEYYLERGLGGSLLYEAIIKGYTDLVEILLEDNRISINDGVMPSGRTALSVACEQNDEAMVKSLIKMKADVNQRDTRGQTYLSIACDKGFLRIAEILIENGALVNARNYYSNNETALHIACQRGDLALVQLLIKSNANPSCIADGKTPLLLALEKGHLAVVRFFLENVDLYFMEHFPCIDVEKALYHAVRDGKKGTVEVLLEFTTYSPKNLYPFSVAGKEKSLNLLHYAYRMDFQKIIKLFVKKANISTSLLALASAQNDEDLVKSILKVGKENPYEQNKKNGQTALHLASLNGHENVVRLLLTHVNRFKEILNFVNETPSSFANMTDHFGRTALHLACQKGHEKVVEQLINIPEININIQDKEGLTPLDLVLKFNHLEVAQLFIQHASCDGNVQLLESLLSRGIKLSFDSVDDKGNTLLHQACLNKNIDFATWLLGYNANILAMNGHNQTPLHLAFSQEDTIFAEVLLAPICQHIQEFCKFPICDEDYLDSILNLLTTHHEIIRICKEKKVVPLFVKLSFTFFQTLLNPKGAFWLQLENMISEFDQDDSSNKLISVTKKTKRLLGLLEDFSNLVLKTPFKTPPHLAQLKKMCGK